MPKRKRGVDFGKLSPELKLLGSVILIIGVLLAYDYLRSPDGTSAFVSGAAGNVVADVQNAAGEVRDVVKEKPAEQPQPVVHGDVKILSPAKGSAQSGDFVVKVQVPSGSGMCYYQIKDSGSTTFDRRTKACGSDIAVKEVYCQTKGVNTCYVYYSASSAGDDVLYGFDEAYYSIQ